MNNIILPPGKIGIIGGGQLGKMLAIEAKKMGYKVIVLEEKIDAPASQVADKIIVGSLKDREQIRKLANEVDVVTYEFEFVNAKILCELEEEGYFVYPSGKTLKKIQNKYIQKKFFQDAKLPVPQFQLVKSVDDINGAIKEYGLPIILKSCDGGYDGKGNFVIKRSEDIQKVIETIDFNKGQFIAEKFVKFNKEISIVVARDRDKREKYFPITENEHENSILKVSKVPAVISSEIDKEVVRITSEIMNLFDDVGVFCIEFFLTDKEEVIINEIAPRPHNSGHYSIEGCVTSQFQQQLRAITGLPLGSTKLISPAVMVNILGNRYVDGNFRVNGINKILKLENTNFHFYGKKSVDFEKKIGHITVLHKDLEKAEEIALNALNNIKIEEEF